MFVGPDCTIIPKDNRLMVLKAEKAYNDRGVSPNAAFPANTIFDSASQVLLTGCRGIIKLQEACWAYGGSEHGGTVHSWW